MGNTFNTLVSVIYFLILFSNSFKHTKEINSIITILSCHTNSKCKFFVCLMFVKSVGMKNVVLYDFRSGWEQFLLIQTSIKRSDQPVYFDKKLSTQGLTATRLKLVKASETSKLDLVLLSFCRAAVS